MNKIEVLLVGLLGKYIFRGFFFIGYHSARQIHFHTSKIYLYIYSVTCRIFFQGIRVVGKGSWKDREVGKF